MVSQPPTLVFVMRIHDIDFPTELLPNCDASKPWKLVELENKKYSLVGQYDKYSSAVDRYKALKRGLK